MTEYRGTLLYVQDLANDDANTLSFVEGLGFLVVHYQEGYDAIESIREGLLYDVAVVDRALNDLPKYALGRGFVGSFTGDEVIEVSKKANPNTPIILHSLAGSNSKLSDLVYSKISCISDLQGKLDELFPQKL